MKTFHLLTTAYSPETEEPVKSMGQITSKSSGLVPRVRFSTAEEEPPRYSSHRFDGSSQQQNDNLQIPPTIVVSDTDSSPSERRGSRVELRRSSIYSTLDLVPQLEHYDSSFPHQQTRSRPSLEALRKAYEDVEVASTTTDSGVSAMPAADGGNEESQAPKTKAPVRFGWVIGVMVRCMLNIWGVILFLRLSWITSQAGILLTWLIILMSVTVTSVTALSISAIATNGRVTSGGAYFMISRSLGPEIGGPIGMVFSFANALACALNTVGFAEVVRDLLQDFNVVMVDAVNDVRIVGVITVTVLLLISLAGMEWESKTQILFFIVLLVSFANYLVGTIIPPIPEKQAVGIFGYRSEIFIENLKPNWRGPEGNFFQMFAIFFPSAIGILSGANISGDLKDPATAIPKGTLTAIFWTTLSYLIISATVASCAVRDASGNMTDILPGNITDGCVGLACNFGWNFTECTLTQSCEFGLANSSKVLGQVSGFYYLITAGVFAASLSSALGFLVSAPKVFQCLCRDNLYPYIKFFAKGYGKNDEPLRAYVLCYIISVAFILIAELNTIAALISNFFLCSYCLINFSCFHASITNSPGWRPSFHYYSKWTALFGAVISVVLMFLFTWWAALITFCIIFFLFGYINYNKPKVNWGSSVQAGTYNMALSYSVSLSGVEDHVKNFRPQCLVLTGPPNQRPALVDFVGSFTKHISLMICGDIIMEQDRQTRPHDATDLSVKWMNKRKVRSFYTPFSGDSLRLGARHLLQASGLGKLKPNTLVMGFKANWRESAPESIEDYINTIYDTFDSNYCLCILRMMDGLDISDQFDFEVNQGFEPDESVDNDDEQSPERESADDISDKGDSDQIKTVFQNDQGKKTIDVYWIADDGGLTLLVPYLLTRRKRWHRSKVRVFIVGDEQNMEEGRNEMVGLLKRFRLDFNDVIVMTDSERRPHAKNLSRFVDSVAPFMLHDEQQEGVSVQELRQSTPWKISDKDFEAFKLKSERKVRLNEIIRRNSQHAALVLVSLPVPQSDCPSALYMAWLDTLTCGLHCPAVLIRGNQQNVLTYYCQ
ncbi:solute carrier family 12 member 10, tandem duplicate 1 [Larimichthys crocea]|uniref:solute carrier family 12 member 10, tandem duplicate 1 n=1 Tax=Larimichthys crocea TaxID=215358 RepID=UPI000F5DB141|nr:solute carrier family 12 member 3 [Larimichthys crocea]